MSLSHRRWLPLSVPRRLVVELLRVCRGLPMVTVQRRLNLAELIAARHDWQTRPRWSAIFLKAFALVAVEMPALRRSYIPLPWAHLYEHPIPVAAVTVERQYQGEEVVFLAQIRGPHTCRLADVDRYLHRCKHDPVTEIGSFRRALRLGRMPQLLQRLCMWMGFHGSGRLRLRAFFGTFCLSTPASEGAGIVHLVTGYTAALHYGLFEADGGLDMWLTFDHRVLDAAAGARALVALETALRGPILAELRGGSGVPAAA